jgi:hypothetical protein
MRSNEIMRSDETMSLNGSDEILRSEDKTMICPNDSRHQETFDLMRSDETLNVNGADEIMRTDETMMNTRHVDTSDLMRPKRNMKSDGIMRSDEMEQ